MLLNRKVVATEDIKKGDVVICDGETVRKQKKVDALLIFKDGSTKQESVDEHAFQLFRQSSTCSFMIVPFGERPPLTEPVRHEFRRVTMSGSDGHKLAVFMEV